MAMKARAPVPIRLPIPGPGPGLGTGPQSRRHVYPREGALLLRLRCVRDRPGPFLLLLAPLSVLRAPPPTSA